jgi:hypothetical protein
MSNTARSDEAPVVGHFWRLSRTVLRYKDSLAEQGGLELPVSREVFPKENLRECWGNFGLTAGCIVQRMSSPLVRSGWWYSTVNSGVTRNRLRYGRPLACYAQAVEGMLIR